MSVRESSQPLVLATYFQFGKRPEYRPICLDVSTMPQIRKISDLGEGLECKILGEVRRGVVGITGGVTFERTLDGLQLRSGSVDVDHV